MVELARIERVNLRDVWSNEAAGFTPWLQKNIDQLGEALGMDLEVDEREAPVGAFSLDLLARDGSGRPVIIENQLGTTDIFISARSSPMRPVITPVSSSGLQRNSVTSTGRR